MRIHTKALALLAGLAMAGLAMAGSCASPESSSNAESQTPTTDTLSVQTMTSEAPAAEVKASMVYTKYELPLPVEIYRYMKAGNGAFDQRHMNQFDPERYDRNIIKAFNFGVYASDLAYCTVFGKNNESVQYFHITRELAADLNIGDGYSQAMVTRLEENMNNEDSLYFIATEAYWGACNYLESNDQVNILPFIVAGGWLESLHLLVSSTNIDQPDDYILTKLTVERQSLENIMDYLYDVMMDSNTFKVNQEVQELGFYFADLKRVYDQNEGPKLSLEQFQELVRQIEAFRAAYI